MSFGVVTIEIMVSIWRRTIVDESCC